MIKYLDSNINKWYNDDSELIKVYYHGAICYYKVDSSSPSGQTPCFAVVADITQYSDTEFEDVFNKADGKWYKLNNLNQYEEYGIYGSGRTSCEGSTSRLPQGYTEVEYIENTGTSSSNGAYLNLGLPLYDTIGNSFIISSRLKSEFYSASGDDTLETIINSESVSSPYYGFVYRYAYSTHNIELASNPSNHATLSTTANTDDTTSLTISCNSTSVTSQVPLGLFASYNANYNTPYRFAKATIYSLTVVKNGDTVRDLVPAKRDSDDKYGLYDLVSNTFYASPNGNNFIGGDPVAPTVCVTTYEGKLTVDGDYEYQYSGNSWVNVGEVSGSTTQTVWLDPSSSSNQAEFVIGHYWGENYKMVWNVYIQGSYSSDIASFWDINDYKTPIEINLYANGFYYDLHNPTSTSEPSVYTGDYNYRIMKNGTLKNYENGQILNIIVTYGTIRVELEETGAAIVTGSVGTQSQNWYNGLYTPKICNRNNSKIHVSSIKVYNANDVLVNDLKFIKNNTTGSQEISIYDSVLDVTYNNTNSNTPTYHIVEDSGGTEYPVYYDEMQNPPNNLSFSSMTEAEQYECPYVGLEAIIAGDKYVFSGDSQSGYEWVYNPSRLPVGYTEVEYIENTTHAYLDIGFVPNQDTRIVCDMQQVTANDYPRLWGAGTWDSANGLNLNYEGGYLQISWFGKTAWTKFTSVPTNYNRHIYDLNKNYLYVDETLIGSNTYTTKTAAASIGIFCEIRNDGQPPTSTNNPQYWQGEYFKGKMFSFKVYDNGTLVRDLVPCIKDSNNTVGAYDIINDVFYTVPTGYTTDKLVAGPTV